MSDERSVEKRSSESVSVNLQKASEAASKFIARSKAENTVRGYRSDWNQFEKWCSQNHLTSLPAIPETIALYASFLAESGRKVSTIERKITSISQAHQAKSLDSPTRSHLVHTVMKGIRRSLGTAQQGKEPVLTDDLKRIVESLGDELADHRDRALLLVGFTGAFRRSELVSLDREDVSFTREGLVITLKKSKTDQEGEGRKVALPYGSFLDTCPVRSLQYWLEISGIQSGPIFRPITRYHMIRDRRLTDWSVAYIVKKRVEAAGLDAKLYAGHSLRSGFATSAAMKGISERDIMKQTGHKSLLILRRYIREGSIFRNNAAGRLGL